MPLSSLKCIDYTVILRLTNFFHCRVDLETSMKTKEFKRKEIDIDNVSISYDFVKVKKSEALFSNIQSKPWNNFPFMIFYMV